MSSEMLAWATPFPVRALSSNENLVPYASNACRFVGSPGWSVGTARSTPLRASTRRPTVTSLLPTSLAPQATVVERAVVWFRIGDLRARDHPGLAAASESTQKSILPVFIFTPDTPPEAVAAIEQLRVDLRARRSDLVVRFAETEVDGLVRLLRAELAGCGRVHVRRDLAMKDMKRMEEGLLSGGADDGAVEVKYWRDELRGIPEDSFRNAPESYPDFLKWGPRQNARTSRPIPEYEPAIVTPGLPGATLDAGAPAVDAGDLEVVYDTLKASRKPCSVDGIAAEYEADSVRLGAVGCPPPVKSEENLAEGVVIDLLQRLEAYENPDVARVLQPVIWFGLVSPRRIRDLVLEHERENGRIFAPIFRLGAKTILQYLDAREFAEILAERDLMVGALVNGDFPPKFYRWRGVLVRYIEAGADAPGAQDKPPLVLIHGFGASCQHMCRTMAEISRSTHCYSFCNLGFGRTEKPPFFYTQYLWELFQADFVRDVVQRRCFVAGNSIGGYFSAAFASDAGDDLCAGVCLVNSAGTLYSPEEYETRQRMEQEQPGYCEALEVKNRSLLGSILRQSRPFRLFACNLLLLYLRGNTARTLSNVYPTTPDGWTDELDREIRRNSYDAGAVDVIQSGLILPPQRSLNDLLLADSCPPIFVFQGRLDPLGSTGRAEKLEQVLVGRDFKVEVVKAGHCPHDEIPQHFSESILSWMKYVNATQDGGSVDSVGSLEPIAQLQQGS